MFYKISLVKDQEETKFVYVEAASVVEAFNKVYGIKTIDLSGMSITEISKKEYEDNTVVSLHVEFNMDVAVTQVEFIKSKILHHIDQLIDLDDYNEIKSIYQANCENLDDYENKVKSLTDKIKEYHKKEKREYGFSDHFIISQKTVGNTGEKVVYFNPDTSNKNKWFITEDAAKKYYSMAQAVESYNAYYNCNLKYARLAYPNISIIHLMYIGGKEAKRSYYSFNEE